MLSESLISYFVPSCSSFHGSNISHFDSVDISVILLKRGANFNSVQQRWFDYFFQYLNFHPARYFRFLKKRGFMKLCKEPLLSKLSFSSSSSVSFSAIYWYAHVFIAACIPVCHIFSFKPVNSKMYFMHSVSPYLVS